MNLVLNLLIQMHCYGMSSLQNGKNNESNSTSLDTSGLNLWFNTTNGTNLPGAIVSGVFCSLCLFVLLPLIIP